MFPIWCVSQLEWWQLEQKFLDGQYLWFVSLPPITRMSGVSSTNVQLLYVDMNQAPLLLTSSILKHEQVTKSGLFIVMRNFTEWLLIIKTQVTAFFLFMCIQILPSCSYRNIFSWRRPLWFHLGCYHCLIVICFLSLW